MWQKKNGMSAMNDILTLHFIGGVYYSGWRCLLSAEKPKPKSIVLHLLKVEVWVHHHQVRVQ